MNPAEVRREWEDRTGEYSPAYYAYYGPNEASERVRATIDARAGPDPSVMEVGCSSGRHLAHLHEHGYEDLHGVDINGDALDVMGDAYPGLAAAGTFRAAAIEDAVAGFDDGSFDAVYSVETLQHLHPEAEWVFGELARVAGDLLVTVENEGDGAGRSDPDDRADHRPAAGAGVNYVTDGLPLYYRDWGRIFTDLGMVEVASRRVAADTLRAFAPGRD